MTEQTKYPHHLTDEEREALPVHDYKKPIKMLPFGLNDPVAWWDSTGRPWHFGMYTDGTWHKRHWGL